MSDFQTYAADRGLDMSSAEEVVIGNLVYNHLISHVREGDHTLGRDGPDEDIVDQVWVDPKRFDQYFDYMFQRALEEKEEEKEEEEEDDEDDDYDEDDEDEDDDDEDEDDDDENSSPSNGNNPSKKTGSLKNKPDADFEIRDVEATVPFFKKFGSIDFSKGIRVDGDTYTAYKRFEIEDLERLDPIERVSEYFIPKLLNDEYMVEDNYSVQYDVKTIIMMVDVSGSMSNNNKMAYVRGLFKHLCSYVNSTVKLLYIEFLDDIETVEWVTDKSQVSTLLKKIDDRSGGNTEVCDVVKTVNKKILSGDLYGYDCSRDNPHIVVINDGQDDVDPKYVPESPLHMFLLDDGNSYKIKEYQDLCKRSSGDYTTIRV